MPHSIDVLIQERGIPLPELAERAAMSVERIDAIAHGRWMPSPDERRRLAAALDLSVEAVSWGHTMNPRNVRYHRYGMPEDLSPPPPTGGG